ncbi:class I SAM-dependent methyltransferase [Pseudodonghicola flavimaris]|uniref:Class I SAM-dependent methyltransferase n=1 Tax=Pseudodonghicola flavimaris TaxID=3050036 RepID=A0ABT7F718_9RHOB|nr:class I SAM-dependent methyltransferase [Pseudodonghicola flavimaris]MDK3020394.1 class I SAM-dependent methyltransferase [Pseudodonghicola flavimaris]
MGAMEELSGKENGDLWGHAARNWAEAQEQTLAPVFDEVLRRTVKPSTSYLDLGCGAGMALAKARALGAAVAGLDASAALLDIARERVPSAELYLGDLEALPFADASFDVVTGFNSFQYAANPVRALEEAARVARPGATIVIVTWGEPEGMDAAQVVSAMKLVLPPPPQGAPGPFALSASERLQAFAEAGGLEPYEILDIESPWIYPDRETALRGLSSSGVAARAIRYSGQEAVDAAHAAAIAPFRQPDGSYRIGARFKAMCACPASS